MFLLTETYLRDNRIFFHLWLLLWADSWNNLWTFSTIWYCIFFCLKKGFNFLEISPRLCHHRVSTFPHWQNSAVFSQRISGCFILFKVTSKLFWIKICNPKEFHLNKNLLFLQNTEGRPPFQFLPYSCKFEGVELCQSLDRKHKIWGLPFFQLYCHFSSFTRSSENSQSLLLFRESTLSTFSKNSYTQLQTCLSWYNFC